MTHKNLRHLSREALENQFKEWNEPRFRAGQVWEWLWQKGARHTDEMSNLPKALRQRLAAEFFIPAVSTHHTQHSTDGTIKNRLQLHDGHFVESVLIPTEKRTTLCVSSQVGCSLSCKFCATGYMPRIRNLEFDEIVDEVTLAQKQAIEAYGKPLSNIVFMGMGEPLLNYRNVMTAIDKITAPDSLGMSPRRITVSTAGVAKMIKQAGDDGAKFKLALSLHAPTDEQRSQIMPINETNHLKALVEALNYFYQKTKSEITLEYILFKDINDSEQDARNLVKIFRQVPADLVNVIEYNPIEKADFMKPDEAVADRFMDFLEKNRVNARLRRSRGKDIDAACGQLANVDTPDTALPAESL